MPFKMHKTFFLEKKIIKKIYICVCLPYLKFPDQLPETHALIFYLAKSMVLCSGLDDIFFRLQVSVQRDPTLEASVILSTRTGTS